MKKDKGNRVGGIVSSFILILIAFNVFASSTGNEIFNSKYVKEFKNSFFENSQNSKDNEVVSLDKCVDGDTAWFNINGERAKVRFLFVDTPESTNEIEPYGKEASSFTCGMLSNAKSIELEYDGSKTDKYGRVLAWVWTDEVLVQEELAKNGYVEKFYDYGNYKYEDKVRRALSDQYSIFKNE